MTKTQNPILKQNNYSQPTIGVLGSHSALDICRGAKDEGFKTLVVCQKGREKTYETYYRTHAQTGCVDECLVLSSFDEILHPKIQNSLQKNNVIFVPNRSFEVYLHFDYESIENNFQIPIFGNRYLLKIEERGRTKDQYFLLQKAGIRYPKQFKNPKDIDCLCFVKILEKERGFERAFFLVNSYRDYKKQVEKKLKKGIFTSEQLKKAVIEEFIVGVQVNLNYFYSPLSKRLEFLGSDTRRQTNIEGLTKLPAEYQKKMTEKISVQYEEAGHQAVTILESLLEDVFKMGEKFVKTSQSLFSPGIIGPFTLQAILIPGPPKKEFVVVDISPRVPGAPGISSTPYSGYLYGQSFSVGRRIAKEIKEAIQLNKLNKILT